MLLYIHIPFCDSKCHYCAFNSYVDLLYLKDSYMKAMLIQLEFELERFEATKGSIESVFIGGGTPSCVEAKEYKNIFSMIKKYLKKEIEITVEANPNSASKRWLEGMLELGVNRVSFGVQSFSEKKLEFLGRNHTPTQAQDAVKSAFDIGFKNISLDLIYDCFMDTKELLKRDIDIALHLPINHISSYSLTIEKGTKFYTKSNLKSDNLSNWFIDEITSRGFTQYEISNFGSYKSKHNLGYWEGKDYIGVGSGAVGFLKNKRFYPNTNVKNYIKNPLSCEKELLSCENLKNEKIFLGLRSEVGVEVELLLAKKVEILKKEKKIDVVNGRVYNRDFLLSDEIALFLMED